MGLVHATSHNYPLIMSFSVEENAVFIHKFSKNLPTVGGRTPPSHTPPPPPPSLAPLARARSLRSLAYYRPPKIKSWLRHCKTRMQTPFESCCVYHRTIASTSREEGLVTAQLHCAVDPYTPLSVGDINAFQNNFTFIISTETCFWLKRVSDRTFFGVSERCVYHHTSGVELRFPNDFQCDFWR